MTTTTTTSTTEFPALEPIDLHPVIKNKIVSLYFNLTRKIEWAAIHELAIEFDSLLDLIFKEIRKKRCKMAAAICEVICKSSKQLKS